MKFISQEITRANFTMYEILRKTTTVFIYFNKIKFMKDDQNFTYRQCGGKWLMGRMTLYFYPKIFLRWISKSKIRESTRCCTSANFWKNLEIAQNVWEPNSTYSFIWDTNFKDPKKDSFRIFRPLNCAKLL